MSAQIVVQLLFYPYQYTISSHELLAASMILSAISTSESATTSTSPKISGSASISHTEHHAALNLGL